MDTLNSSESWFFAFWITIQLLEFMFIPLYYSQGGGESLDQLYDRCTSALERIGGKHQGMVSPFVSRFFTIRGFAEPMFNQVLVSLWTEWPHILFTFWDSHDYLSKLQFNYFVECRIIFQLQLWCCPITYSFEHICLTKSNLVTIANLSFNQNWHDLQSECFYPGLFKCRRASSCGHSWGCHQNTVPAGLPKWKVHRESSQYIDQYISLVWWGQMDHKNLGWC